jgi:hypothetical protein
VDSRVAAEDVRPGQVCAMRHRARLRATALRRDPVFVGNGIYEVKAPAAIVSPVTFGAPQISGAGYARKAVRSGTFNVSSAVDRGFSDAIFRFAEAQVKLGERLSG